MGKRILGRLKGGLCVAVFSGVGLTVENAAGQEGAPAATASSAFPAEPPARPSAPPQAEKVDPAPPTPAPSPSSSSSPALALPNPRPEPELPPTTDPNLPREPPQFGEPGQWVFSGAFDLNVGHTGYSNTSAGASWITFAPSFDYFASQNISVGGWVSLGYGTSRGYLANEVTESSTVTYGAGGRVGYNYRMGSFCSWWVRGGLSAWRQHFSKLGPADAVTSANGTSVPFGDYDDTAVTFSVTAPILLHPATHFFIGFGPELHLDLKHTTAEFDNERTYWGASSMVGGWF